MKKVYEVRKQTIKEAIILPMGYEESVYGKKIDHIGRKSLTPGKFQRRK